jgi:hypothetical protein
MKVKIMRNVLVCGEHVKAGSIETLPDNIAWDLIHANKAVVYKNEPKQEKPKKKKGKK